MTTVGSGQTLNISNGQTSDGIVVAGGGTLNVLFGGTVSNTIDSGGIENVEAGGTDLGAQISSGVQDVSGYASGATIFAGSQVVQSGGSTVGTTVSSGGLEVVDDGGADEGVQISGGEQDVFGLVNFATVNAGSQVIESGGTASYTTIFGGSEIVRAGGTDFGGSIWADEQDVYGTTSEVTVYDGSQVVESGGVASDTTISDFSYQYVEAAGTATDTTISLGGSEIVSAGAAMSGTATIAGGTLVLEAGAAGGAVDFVNGGTLQIGGTSIPSGLVVGGFAAGDTIDLTSIAYNGAGTASASGSALDVFESGKNYDLQFASALSGTFVLGTDGASGTDVTSVIAVGSGQTIIVSAGQTSGGFDILNGGVVEVLSGGMTNATIVSGGKQDVFGSASGATIFNGSQMVESGGDAEATAISGGTETVSSGGTDDGASISGGEQDVRGIATFAVVHAGSQVIESGGTASVTTVEGGREIVSAGGTDFDASIFGGEQDVFGLTSEATIYVGSQVVESGGVASGTTINGSTFLYVESGGTAIDPTISGTLELFSGGSLGSGPVTFAGQQGALVLDTTSMPANVISGFGPGDVVDLAAVSYAGGSVTLTSGNVLKAVVNATTYALQLDPAQHFTGDQFYLLPDGNGDTDIAVGLLNTVSSGVTVSNSSVGADNVQAVFGKAVNATIDSGGAQLVQGGTATGTTIDGGGDQGVYGSGSATGTTINAGGEQQVYQSGKATSTTVNAGGTQFIESGGLAVGDTVYAFGTAIGRVVVGSGGIASSTTVSSGAVLELLGGAIASGFSIAPGGTLEIGSGYALSGYAVSSGVTLELLGGAIASGFSIAAGGTLEIASGYVLSGYAVTSSVGLNVVSGGTASATIVSSGGLEDVFAGGTDLGAQIRGGLQFVLSGGVTRSATVSSGGTQNIETGGVASGTIVGSGGTQDVGGTASGTIIDSGGIEEVQGGTADGAIIDGGTLELFNGGSLGSGAITFSGTSGTLLFFTTTMPGSVISGFAPGDVINLTTVSFAGGSLALTGGNELKVVISGTTYALQFDPSQSFSTSGFYLSPDDREGGTDIALGAVVSSGQTVSNSSVTAGNVEAVYGTAIATTIESGGTLLVESGGTASNTTILSGGTLELLSGAEITGTMVSAGGTISVNGTIEDQGGTIDIGSGQLDLGSQFIIPAIIGGTIADDGTGTVVGAGTFDGVTLEGTLVFGKTTKGQAPNISIEGGLTLVGANGTGPATLDIIVPGSRLSFVGNETLENAVINSDGNLYNAGTGAVLTFGPDLTINASGGFLGGDENSGDGIVNDGTINYDPTSSFGDLGIDSESFTNDGKITATNGGGYKDVGLNFFPFFLTNALGASITLGNSTTLSLGANALLNNQGQFVNPQWSNQGQIGVGSNSTVDLEGDWTNQGQITIGSNSTVTIGGPEIFSGSTGTYTDTWSNQGTITIGAGSTIDIIGTISPANLESLVSNGSTVNGSTIDIGGTLDLTGQTITIGKQTLTIGSGPTLSPVFFDDGSRISGTGTINGAINANVTNLSAIEASGGTMVVNGPIGPSVVTSFLIDANSTLVIGGAADSEYTFNGSSATLILESPSTFTGTLAGLAIGDTIDLVNTAVNSATVSGKTLTIDESNGGVLNFNLAAALSNGDAIQVASDGLGGTDLIIQTASPYSDFFNAAGALSNDLTNNASASQISSDGISVYTTTVAGAIGTLGGSNWEAAYDNSSQAATTVYADFGFLNDTLSLFDTIVAGTVGSIASGASQSTYQNILQAAGTLATDIEDDSATTQLQSDLSGLYGQIAGSNFSNSSWQQALAASDQAAATLGADLANGAGGDVIQSDAATLYDTIVSGSLGAVGGASLQQSYDGSGNTIVTLSNDISSGASDAQLQQDVAGLYDTVISGVDTSATPLASQDYQSAISAANGLVADLVNNANASQIWFDTVGIFGASLSGQLGTASGADAEQSELNFTSALDTLAADGHDSVPSGTLIQTLTADAVANVVGSVLGSAAQTAYTNASGAAQTLFTDVSGGAAPAQALSDVLGLFAQTLGEYDVINGGASSQAYGTIVQAAQALNADIANGNATAIQGDVTALINATDVGDTAATGTSAVWNNISQGESGLVIDIEDGADAARITADAGELYDALFSDSENLVGTPDPALTADNIAPSTVASDIDVGDENDVLGDALNLVSAIADPCPGMGKPPTLLQLLDSILKGQGFYDTFGSIANKASGAFGGPSEAFPTLGSALQNEAKAGLSGLTSTGSQFVSESAGLVAQEGLGAALDGPLFAVGLYNLWFDGLENYYKGINQEDAWQNFLQNTPQGQFLDGLHNITKFADPFYDLQYLIDSWAEISWQASHPVGKAHDDVHLQTYDGLLYDFQAAGEFILTQSTLPGNSFEVQVRMEPWAGSNSAVSVMTMIGAEVGSDRVTFAIDRTNTVWVDGTPITMSPGTAINLSGGQLSEIAASTYQLNWNTGESITVTDLRSWLNVSASLGPTDGPGSVQGLLGPNEGQANDFQLPDGTFLSQPLTSTELYGEFADAWRLTQANSLLDYGQGQTTATFTDLSFPSDAITLADLPQSVVSQAAQVVAAAGITDPNLAAAAELDYIATGDPDFVAGDAAAQIPGGTTAAGVTQSTPPATALGVMASSSTVVESAGAPTAVVFDLYLTSASSTDTPVDYAVVTPDVGYFTAADFGGILPSGEVTISAGQTSGQFTIEVPANALGTQPSENLGVQITALNGTKVLGATAETVVANDQPEPGNPATPVLEDLGDIGTFTQNGNAYTLNLGTLPFGDMPEIEFPIVNEASAPGDELTGGFTVTAGSGVAFSGDTTFAALAPGQVYTGLLGTIESGILGANSETLTFTPQELNASGYQAVLPNITLTINYAVELSAGGVVNSPTTINFGAARAGTSLSQQVSVSNITNAGAASLDASFSLAGAATGTGAIAQLSPGATDDTSLSVGLDTNGNSGGVVNGIASVEFSSDTGGGNTLFLGSVDIDVSGTVYRTGTASIPAIIAHVGDPTSRMLAITNSDPADGYSESLEASLVSTSGGVTASGGPTGEIAPQATSNAISVGYSTASVGTVGTVTLDFTTDGTGIDGFGTEDLGDQTYSVVVNNYAQAGFEERSGGGNLTQNGDAYTLDLGPIIQGTGPVTVGLGVLNGATGPADTLGGTFAMVGDSAFTNSGFAAFSGVSAGGADTAPTVALTTSSLGTFTETITLDPTGSNPSGYAGALAAETFTISGTVISSVEYVSAGAPVSGGTVISGLTQDVVVGGVADAVAVDSGGTQIVFSGGTASGTIVSSGGTQDVNLGGTALGTTVSSGGTQYDAGFSSDTTLNGGTEVVFGSDTSATVDSGGIQEIDSGGAAFDTTVSSGGVQYDAGTASGTTLDGGTEVVFGSDTSATVNSGGIQEIAGGGTASDVTIHSGGTVEVVDGGTLEGSIANAGTLAFDIVGSTTFSGSLTGSGTLVVSSGGDLHVAMPYSGSAEIDNNSTLEFGSTFTGEVTFRGSPTGPDGTLKLDAGSTGAINVVNPNDTVIAQPGSGNWINASVSYTLPTNIDTLFLFAGARGAGNSDASGDALYALDAGNAQTLIGNSANDSFVVYNASDVVVPKAGSHDTVYAAASYTLPTGVDALYLEAGTRGVGNSDASGDALYAANPGQVATLIGNSPNDTFVVYNSSDVVVPKAGSHDAVYSAANYTLPTGVDVLYLEAGTQGVGNGDAAGDALYAADAGIAQTLSGNSANDTFVVYNSADVVVPKAGSHDIVYSAVNFTLPTGADSLILEGSAAQGVGNSDAAGDTLYAANAGIAQTLTGHSHNDSFVVYNSGDVVVGQAGSADTVYAASSFTLPTNVDTLFLEGTASHGSGNNDAVDTLFGNAGVASTLVAGSGADALYVAGTAGTTLTGGAGSDTFAFPNVMGHVEVANFGIAKDTLQFNATLFANFTAAMNAASQSGANTVFTIDTNDTVTLDNVTKSSLAAGNFHFT